MENECEWINGGSLLLTLVCDFDLKLYISVDDEDAVTWKLRVSEDDEKKESNVDNKGELGSDCEI